MGTRTFCHKPYALLTSDSDCESGRLYLISFVNLGTEYLSTTVAISFGEALAHWALVHPRARKASLSQNKNGRRLAMLQVGMTTGNSPPENSSPSLSPWWKNFFAGIPRTLAGNISSSSLFPAGINPQRGSPFPFKLQLRHRCFDINVKHCHLYTLLDIKNHYAYIKINTCIHIFGVN
jgi:hypothetical protein